ncbi:MAG: hypothetical protein C4294_20110, partial [Nitrospiraceae bacterium]
MDRSVRTAAWVVGVLLAAGYLWAARTPPPPQPQPTQVPVQAQAVQARLVIRHRGAPQVALEAKKVTAGQGLTRATLEGVSRAVVYREGKEFLRVRASRI